MGFNPQVIKETFAQAKPMGAHVVDRIFDALISDQPSTGAVFKNIDMRRLKQNFLNAMVFIVDNIDKPDQLKPYLQDLGARHVQYGVKAAYFPVFGKALIGSLQSFFKSKWTDEINQQWEEAFLLITESMLEGANEVEKYYNKVG